MFLTTGNLKFKFVKYYPFLTCIFFSFGKDVKWHENDDNEGQSKSISGLMITLARLIIDHIP